ncbi:hypothetical protein [Paenibacillus glufosinatiresistens]|uniref:hypothetical protein n=1 Tax=Paenibacillus glufosinatiresistens TaxID=3070657 RepID=UPI00286E3E88|nr:hypothetical protein [Paenibacillus sp. YX.27]
MTKLIIGIFGHRSDASLAIEELGEQGVKSARISMIAREKQEADIISQDTGLRKPQEGPGSEGLFGTARNLAIGLDLLPDTAVASGAAAKAAGAEFGDDPGEDGLVVSLMSMGIPAEDAELYERHVDLKRILVLVLLQGEEAESDEKGVREILDRHEAIPLHAV